MESCEFSNRDVSQLTSLTSPDIPISIKLHTEIEKNSIHPFDPLHCGVVITCGGSKIYQRALAPEKSAPTYYFCLKLRENERIWTERGACIPGVPRGSATDYGKIFYFWKNRNGFQNTRIPPMGQGNLILLFLLPICTSYQLWYHSNYMIWTLVTFFVCFFTSTECLK